MYLYSIIVLLREIISKDSYCKQNIVFEKQPMKQLLKDIL
jgi:hypothetical protein